MWKSFALYHRKHLDVPTWQYWPKTYKKFVTLVSFCQLSAGTCHCDIKQILQVQLNSMFYFLFNVNSTCSIKGLKVIWKLTSKYCPKFWSHFSTQVAVSYQDSVLKYTIFFDVDNSFLNCSIYFTDFILSRSFIWIFGVAKFLFVSVFHLKGACAIRLCI